MASLQTRLMSDVYVKLKLNDRAMARLGFSYDHMLNYYTEQHMRELIDNDTTTLSIPCS